MAFLELAGLEKTYADGTRAVKGIDLSIERGEFIVLLGPSGCGKTTTLRMIAGLELPTGGTIRLDGAEVSQLPPSARDVGFVFQFYALYPHLTVAQNLAFPLECVGTPRGTIDATVQRVAARLGLGPLLKRRPRQLSGGDQQRVALGRAMVREPKVWLMDEPLGTLDADRRLAMCEFLRERQLESKVTTVYVTHDQEEAMRLADRVVVMSHGKIEQVGAPAAVYDRPSSLFVAHFVGSPGMNFLHEEKRVLGIRPEFVTLEPDTPAAASAKSLRGKVVVDEYLGASRCLHVATSAGTIVARTGADAAARVGDAVALRFDERRILWYDAKSGALCP